VKSVFADGALTEKTVGVRIAISVRKMRELVGEKEWNERDFV